MPLRVACFFYFIPTWCLAIRDTPCPELPERSTGWYQIPPSKRATVLNPRETIESVAGKIQLNRPTALHAAQASLELRELVPPGFAH